MQLLVEVSTNRRSRKKENDKKGMKEGKKGNTKFFAVQIRRPIKKELNYLKL